MSKPVDILASLGNSADLSSQTLLVRMPVSQDTPRGIDLVLTELLYLSFTLHHQFIFYQAEILFDLRVL